MQMQWQRRPLQRLWAPLSREWLAFFQLPLALQHLPTHLVRCFLTQAIAEAEKTAFYLNFRSSGIAYGPRHWKATTTPALFCFSWTGTVLLMWRWVVRLLGKATKWRVCGDW